MSDFINQIKALFTSTGYFSDEYEDLLYSLDQSQQKRFITQLYKVVTTNQYRRLLLDEELGIKKVKGKVVYRYSKNDLSFAKDQAPMVSERILKAQGCSDDEILEYRATAVFVNRKLSEIQSSTPSIEEQYRSILSRVNIDIGKTELIAINSLYSIESFELLKLPSYITQEKLLQLLKEQDLRSCFSSPNHYTHFKSNSFELLSDGKQQLLNIPISKKQKKMIAGKLFNLYRKFSGEKTDYPDLDLTKDAFAKILMVNFEEFRHNSGLNPTFESTLSNVSKSMR